VTWIDGTLVAFDTETTSANPETARIVTASVVVIRPLRTPEVHEWLADPGIEIPAEAAAIHGVTTERARAEGDDPCVVVTEICMLLAELVEQEVPVIVYNAPFDLTLLDRECRRRGVPPLDDGRMTTGPMRVVDPLVCDRALDRYRKGKRTLSATSAHYGVPISETDAHGSTADALCAARVAWKIARRYPAECGDLDALQDKQAAWYRTSSRSFRTYLTRTRGTLTDPAEIASIDTKIAGIREIWPQVPYTATEPMEVSV
jgi:DNA polymerase-3 subunit epsilon